MAISKIILNGVTQMDVTQKTVTSASMLDGITAMKNDGTNVTGNIESKSASDLTASGATVTVPAGYYASQATKSVSSGTATPASSISATGATVTAGTNTLTLSKSVSNTPQVSSGYISSGTAGNTSVSLTVSVSTRSSSDLTVSGGTVTAPAGYYDSSASKAVASGTAGTPTATKGTVSNHSVSVTPSVTNTTGYITGSTKTGTAVTVSASELVSGSETKTANGTYDVTNLAELVVNVSGGGGASNVVMGDFTTGSTRGTQGTVSLSYSGTGYPIACFVYVYGGAYNNGTGGNTTWYNSLSRYDCGWYGMVKSRTTTAPTYGSTGADNYGTVAVIYKNSTSNATSYTRTSNMATNTYTTASIDASAGTYTVVFKGNGTTLSYYIGKATSGAVGFPPSTKMAYIVIYSS